MVKVGVANSNEIFEVQNVYCIGKNYLEHIKEFDNSGNKNDIPDEPLIFMKPNTAIVCNSKTISIPEYKNKQISDNLQNEVELVLAMGRDGEKIEVKDAYDYILGYAVGIDFTLRDVQSEFKKKGLPWTLSKGFLNSAPVSNIKLKDEKVDECDLKIMLWINGELKQNSRTSDMIFNIPYLIHYISSIFGIRKGDLIFTGTPAGITKLNPGDKIRAEIEKVGELNLMVI